MQWCQVFQPISLQTIFSGSFLVRHLSALHFTISWLISTFSILFTISNCFLQSFNHSSYWLCSFLILQISLQNLILDNSVTLFFSVQFFVHLFRVTWNNRFCLNCETICLYLLTFVFFVIKLCFSSSITKFIPFFFNLRLAFSPLIFLFLFFPVSLCLSYFSLLISFLRLVISLSILLFHHDPFISPFLPFFTPTSFATQWAAAIVSLFVWVILPVSICLTTAFTFLVASLNFLWPTFLKSITVIFIIITFIVIIIIILWISFNYVLLFWNFPVPSHNQWPKVLDCLCMFFSSLT